MGQSSWSAPAVDQAPVFSQDFGVTGNQIDGTSHHLTTLDQAPRFSHDPSGILLQQESAWLSVNSRGQASTSNNSYDGFITRLQPEEQPAFALVQSSMFSQDYVGAAEQSAAAGYEQLFKTGESSEQALMPSRNYEWVTDHGSRINSLLIASVQDSTCSPDPSVITTHQNDICYSTATLVQAPVFSQDPGGVRGNVHRPVYLTVGADQVSTSCQDLSEVSDHLNSLNSCEVSTQGIVSSTNLPLSDQFSHASYLAASLGHAPTYLQNSGRVYS